jgi:imidazole glycerol-phosphate synthase subunit HisH
MITIIDYGMGNLHSIKNMFKKIGYSSIISSDIDVISKAEKIILPGIGAFDNAMQNIEKLGLFDILNQKALIEKIPILGVCLGMQLMTEGSEEGMLPGLKWIEAKTKKFTFEASKNLKIPHMGWNVVQPTDYSSIFKGMNEEEIRFYFVHSYYVHCEKRENILAESEYGGLFTCALHKDNLFATQYHPEKSHRFGMTLYTNFAKI